ncbi:MAG: hypothetical protein H3C47_02180 [Candidatus Cloacimonetes bacterium]|nr:hypothetical protein [Candidatus Cloacimonadota bacterium]
MFRLSALWLFHILINTCFSSEPDLSIHFSRQMVQKVSGLAAGELKHAFWLDLESGTGSTANLSLNLALPFSEIPGSISVNGGTRKVSDLLTPVCNRAGEIFENASCAADGTGRPQDGIKLRVRIPFAMRILEDSGKTLHLQSHNKPEISASYDADIQRYLQLVSQAADISARVEAIYRDETTPWEQQRPKVEVLIRDLRAVKALTTRFESRSAFFAIPDAATIRRLLAQARVEETLRQAVSTSGASLEQMVLGDDLRVSLKVNQVARVFAPYMPGVVMSKMEVQMLSREGSDAVPYLLLEGEVR